MMSDTEPPETAPPRPPRPRDPAPVTGPWRCTWPVVAVRRPSGKRRSPPRALPPDD